MPWNNLALDHRCQACDLETLKTQLLSLLLQLLKPTHLEPVLHSKRSHHNEHAPQQRVAPAVLASTRECQQSNEDPLQPKIIDK